MQNLNQIFTTDTYNRLSVISPNTPKFSDSIVKYFEQLIKIEFIKPDYIQKKIKSVPLAALIDSRFARFSSILNGVKQLKEKYVIVSSVLFPHSITIYGNNISKEYINHVASIVNWWAKIKPQKYSIVLYLTNLEKILPPDDTLDKILTEEYMNSGFTFIQDPNDIHIFRKEESLKVLIHELIHASSFDFNNNHLLNIPIPIKDENITNEGITEYLAINFYYWYVATWMCTSTSVSTNVSTNVLVVDQFIDLLSNDLGWQHYQISKILNYFNITDPTILLTKNHNFKQKTSVISYFIFKNYLFFHDSFPILINRDITKINELIAQMTVYIKNIKIINIHKDSVSMRMSLYELNC